MSEKFVLASEKVFKNLSATFPEIDALDLDPSKNYVVRVECDWCHGDMVLLDRRTEREVECTECKGTGYQEVIY